MRRGAETRSLWELSANINTLSICISGAYVHAIRNRHLNFDFLARTAVIFILFMELQSKLHAVTFQNIVWKISLHRIPMKLPSEEFPNEIHENSVEPFQSCLFHTANFH